MKMLERLAISQNNRRRLVKNILIGLINGFILTNVLINICGISISQFILPIMVAIMTSINHSLANQIVIFAYIIILVHILGIL